MATDVPAPLAFLDRFQGMDAQSEMLGEAVR
jgi:hypothetical protein